MQNKPVQQCWFSDINLKNCNVHLKSAKSHWCNIQKYLNAKMFPENMPRWLVQQTSDVYQFGNPFVTPK